MEYRIDYWLDRFQNDRQLQKQLQWEFVEMRFTERDMFEIYCMLSDLKVAKEILEGEHGEVN